MVGQGPLWPPGNDDYVDFDGDWCKSRQRFSFSGWNPVSPVHNYRTVADSFHTYHI